MTQAALAKALFLPRVTYTHYELGKRTPDLDMIIAIARYYRVSVDYLIGNSDDKHSVRYETNRGSEYSLVADSGDEDSKYS